MAEAFGAWERIDKADVLGEAAGLAAGTTV
jgi:hypothetical protein